MILETGMEVTLKTESELNRDEYDKLGSSIKEILGKTFIVNRPRNTSKYTSLKTLDGNDLKDGDGILWISYDIIGITIKLNVGDEIETRKDLKVDKEYSGMMFIEEMNEFMGKKLKIVDIEDNYYVLEGCDKLWSKDMFVNTTTKDKPAEKQEHVGMPKYYEYKVGDLIVIRKGLKKGDSIDGVEVKSGMIKTLGKIAKITSIKSNCPWCFKIDCNSDYWYSNGMTENIIDKDIFKLDIFSDKRYAIKLNNESEKDTIVKLFKNMKLTWIDGNEITKESLADIDDITFWNKVKSFKGKLTSCDNEWYKQNQFRIIDFKDIFFCDDIDSVIKASKVNKTDCNISTSQLSSRGLHMGDIYYKEEDGFNGWYIAMNGYSVGLNTDIDGAWSSLEHDISSDKSVISKIIMFDKDIQSYCRVSQFIKTCEESLVQDMITTVG